MRIQRVSDILTRPVYAGYVEAPAWGISLRKGNHEGLISFETYQKIQARLHNPDKITARKDTSADFPLRGAVVCADCGSPLTSCWSKGQLKPYPYYLCHKRSCVSYRKSIPRKQIEGQFEAILKELQPTQSLFSTARAMFKDIWDHHLANAAFTVTTAKQEITKIERQIEQLLDRVVEASSPAVISAYEQRIAKLEEEKIIMQERMENMGGPHHPFEQMFEHSMTFLSSPWKLWFSGNLALKRVVLKLAFGQRLIYDRKSGFRAADLSLPFKALASIKDGVLKVARPAGLEPATCRLEGGCSIQLSYGRAYRHCCDNAVPPGRQALPGINLLPRWQVLHYNPAYAPLQTDH